MALAGVVAPAEEILWGRMVQPSMDTTLTALLFAAKHVAIDRRTRRALGLALFEVGLGLVRRRPPRTALVLHAGANGAGGRSVISGAGISSKVEPAVPGRRP